MTDDPRCPGCGRAFDSPDHDPRCSSCAEAGMLEDPPPPGATNCPQCARMLSEICRLSFELGKAEGALASARITIAEGARSGAADEWRAHAAYLKQRVLKLEAELSIARAERKP